VLEPPYIRGGKLRLLTLTYTMVYISDVIKRNRTNIYLDKDQQKLLKHLAVDQGRPVAQLVREAISGFWIPRVRRNKEWSKRFSYLIDTVQARIPASLPADEIEADITKEVRARRARRKLG
jgi:Ribbon-helix-helix protein, copG family